MLCVPAQLSNLKRPRVECHFSRYSAKGTASRSSLLVLPRIRCFRKSNLAPFREKYDSSHDAVYSEDYLNSCKSVSLRIKRFTTVTTDQLVAPAMMATRLEFCVQVKENEESGLVDTFLDTSEASMQWKNSSCSADSAVRMDSFFLKGLIVNPTEFSQTEVPNSTFLRDPPSGSTFYNETDLSVRGPFSSESWSVASGSRSPATT